MLGAAVDRLDGRLVACTAADHDAAVARTSHVPHVAAQALSRILGNGERGLRAALAGPAWRDMTRVARSDPGLWVEILSLNRAGVLAALDELEEELRWFEAALEAGDRDGLEASWRAAGERAAGAPPARRRTGGTPRRPSRAGTRCSPTAARAAPSAGCGCESAGEDEMALRYEVAR